jgi:putative endonuclease
MERSDVGRTGEDVAVCYLETRGWRVVERNFRRREGEIDIVATRRGVLAFVEVKTRRSRAFGSPSEAVTRRKQARIRSLARAFLAERRPRARVVRFDVVDILWDARGLLRVEHLEGVF